MSFWNFVKDILPTVATVGATVYGAKVASDASDKATQQLDQSNQAATNAQLQGLQTAERNLQINRQAASPGLLAMQEIIARGDRLTPEQEQAVADTRRTTLDSLQGSSLRGSGRATAAVLADAEKRVRNNFMTQNQNRSDTAAGNLSGQYFGAGNNVANINAQQGNTVSQGLINSGNVTAANTLGQSSIQGQAIGDIGAVIADSLKGSMQEKRGSSYQPYEDIAWNQ